MSSQTKQIKTIAAIQREANSRSGNPRYSLFFTDGSSGRTKIDTDCAFEIGNPGYRRGDRVAIDFTDAGQIIAIYADPSGEYGNIGARHVDDVLPTGCYHCLERIAGRSRSLCPSHGDEWEIAS